MSMEAWRKKFSNLFGHFEGWFGRLSMFMFLPVKSAKRKSLAHISGSRLVENTKMVKFLISSFAVNFVKENGSYITITGVPEDRSVPMKIKKYLRQDELPAVYELIAASGRAIDIIITGKRKPTDFEQEKNHVQLSSTVPDFCENQ